MSRKERKRKGSAQASERLSQLAVTLLSLGVAEHGSVTVRVSRHNGKITSLQLVHPTQTVRPEAAGADLNELLDTMDTPEYGTASFKVTMKASDVVHIKLLQQEKSIDLDSL